MQIFKVSGGQSGCTYKTEEKIPRGCVLALGFFDGVHLGHAKLISEAKRYAEAREKPLAVWTFDSLPKAERLITTAEERLDALSSVGADYIITERFDAVRSLSPEEFSDSYLRENFSPTAVFCGFNFRYGRNAAGGAETLKSAGKRNGYEVFALLPFMCGDSVLSSSLIRSLIADGKVDEANALLTHPFSLTAEVVHGRALGRTIGYPTVNQHFPCGKLIPKHGVYATHVIIDGREYRGITNVGFRPTVNGDENDISAETHVLGYSGESYGDTVTVRFMKMLREERKFPSLDALGRQITGDRRAAETFFSEFQK